MYYYLFEPNATGRESAFTRAKSLVNLHGITGEMATPSPAQPVEDLLTRAADKGYNTIVAVGGDRFITAVAKLLAKSDIAYGAIPVGASVAMEELFGVKTLDQAVLSLKQRKIADTGIGIIAPGKVFLLDATIRADQSSPVTVSSKLFSADGTFTTLTIERKDLVTVRFHDSHVGPSPLRKFATWLFGRASKNPSETILRAPTLTITTPNPLPVTIDGEPAAKTPCKVRVVPNALKLIQARATLSEKEQPQ